MIKKSIYIIFSFLCVCVFLSACSGNTLNHSATDTEDTLPPEYDAIIHNIINAYPWNDDDQTIVPEQPELSDMYRHNSSLSEIGFSLIDLDNNGQKELLISDISKPYIYDLYTISEGKVTHLFSSVDRNFYLLYENGFLENGWLGASTTSSHDFYKLNEGKLVFIERISLDANHALTAGVITDLTEANEDNCFFRSDSMDENNYKLITSDEALSAIETYQSANKPLNIEYTLLSEYKH